MKDIPVFTSENGAASLFLSQIPYTGIGRVTIHASQTPEKLLKECADFCRACGADEVHASGHEMLAQYPLVTTIVQMQAQVEGMDETDAALFPVTRETVGEWRNIVNDRMKEVHNASFLTYMDEGMLLRQGDCYFVHRNGELLGVGRAAEDTIQVVASVKPGAGADVVMALCRLIHVDTVKVTVASTNLRAVRLYERLGFVLVREIAKWYKIL